MQFNQYIWQLYIQSKEGKKTLRRLEKLENVRVDESYLHTFLGTDLVPKTKPYKPHSDEVKIIDSVCDFAKKISVTNFREAAQLYQRLIEAKLKIFEADKDNDELILDAEGITLNISLVSIGLHLAHREFFLPYSFVEQFDKLLSIAENFTLSLPPLPKKANFESKSLYYYSLNQLFHDFRKTYKLSASEMCAFLYDFALNFVKDFDLPEPSKVWLVVGSAYSSNDFAFLESADESAEAGWQGNLETRIGDIIVMYAASPYSYIHSIWRSMSNGFVEPFSDLHSLIWITRPIKTLPITFKEIRNHPLLSQNGYVRANLQGPTGRPLAIEEYEAILEMMAAKGQDVSVLPRIPRTNFIPSGELVNERDVEIRLVEPLLEKLGYSSRDWVRQMPVRMGRGERNYPDYVFGAKQKRGEESAVMVLETKYSLSREKDLREAYFQMRSYALRLQAQKAVLAAREGIWLFLAQKNNFSFERHSKYNWLELSNPDTLHNVCQLIGK